MGAKTNKEPPVDDAGALAKVVQTIGRLREVSIAAGQQGQTAAALTEQLAQVQAGVRAQLEQSTQSLQAIEQSVGALQLEADQQFVALVEALERGIAEERPLRSVLAQVRQNYLVQLQRLEQITQEQLPPLLADIGQASQSVSATLASTQILALQSAAECQRLRAASAQQRQALLEMRARLEQQAESIDQHTEQFTDSLLRLWKDLEVNFENARAETRQRFDSLLAEAAQVQKGAAEEFQQCWNQQLAEQIGSLAAALEETLFGLRELAKPTRKLADSEVLTSIQKVRESFDPLQDIEKVFRAAHGLELC